MNKFIIILRKEFREILTPSAVIGLAFIFILFYFLGDFMESVIKSDSDAPSNYENIITDGENSSSNDNDSDSSNENINGLAPIGFIDNDNSEISRFVAQNLSSMYFLLTPPNAGIADSAKWLEVGNYKGEQVLTLVVIPEGFGANIAGGVNSAVEIYTTINSFGLTDSMNSSDSTTISSVINSIVSQKLFADYAGGENINVGFMQYPVYLNESTIMNGEVGEVSPGIVRGYISSQTMFIPIIVFLIIMLASQLLANSVMNEKADKTLETLMTTPVSRISVLIAKVLAATLYAGLYSAVYIVGYQRFMDGMQGGSVFTPELIDKLDAFGISFSASTFGIIGIQLFLSVLCGLAVALIIGLIVEDIKSLQSFLMPLIFIIMIPYFITMFVDVNTMPFLFKILIYAIPFSHTFTAAVNIFSGNSAIIAFGIVYQAIFVAALLFAGIKLFTSDKLFTLSAVFKGMGKKKDKKNNVKSS